jgi:hypothetical protein
MTLPHRHYSPKLLPVLDVIFASGVYSKKARVKIFTQARWNQGGY